MAVLTSSVNDLNKFYRKLTWKIIIFSLVISAILLGNFLNLFQGATGTLSQFFSSGSQIGSLSSDYNFDLVPAFLGMIGVFYFLADSKSLFEKAALNFTLIIYSVVIFFSGSRRGFIILTMIISVLLFMQIYSLVKRESKIKSIAYSSRWYLISTIMLAFLTCGFLFNTSYNFKKRALSSISPQNLNSIKTRIANGIFKYNSIINKKESESDLYEKIWFNNYDKALDPETGWGTRIHQAVFPLTGENVEIVPPNAVGYLMDKSCDPSPLNGNAYSYTLIGLDKVEMGSKVQTSAFCFVSKDFDGTWVRISAEGDMLGKTIQEYDLSKKGIWQKLQINFEVKSDIPRSYLYWAKYGVIDFTSLKGYVIFAFPKNVILSKNDSIQSLLNYPVKYNSIGFIKNDLYIHNHFESALFGLHLPKVTIFLQNGIDRDPLRNWVSSLISEDTTYHGYKSKIDVGMISNGFFGPRLMRWKFAGKIFLKEYNLEKKLFGGGFNFLNWYGFYFLKDKTLSDYPHNPILSILLYSGIFGLLIYLVFFYKIILLYLRFIRVYPILIAFFLITFFFSFFSAGSPFDPPIMGFFMLLPFFINYISNLKTEDS